MTTIKQWDIFETSISVSRQYGDPFRDVELRTVFTAPDGRDIAFRGFYDGGGLWRLRFMPDKTGVWTYRAAFSDGSGETSGSFECVESDIPGMVTLYAPNPIWFGYGYEKPAYIRSLHVGDRFFAANWPAAKRSAFLDWLAGHNYNMISVASHYLNRNAEGRGKGWETPSLWPLNPGQFQLMEDILRELARRRIIVFPFAGFFGRESNYPRDPADQELFIRYTLARIAPFWNIVLNVAGPEPGAGVGMDGALVLDESDIDRIAGSIRANDPFKHPLSVHHKPGDFPYASRPWCDYVTLQGWKDKNWNDVYAGMMKNHHPQKPLYAQEVFWPGNTIGHGEFSADEIRIKAAVLSMAGATINFGDMHGKSSSGFSGTLELDERVDERHAAIGAVWDFIERIGIAAFTPAPHRAHGAFCMAKGDDAFLIYTPAPDPFSLTLPAGTFNAEWFFPPSFTMRRPAGTVSGAGTIEPPAEGITAGVFLVLRRTNP